MFGRLKFGLCSALLFLCWEWAVIKSQWLFCVIYVGIMKMSSNGNIFHVTDSLWGNHGSPVDSLHKDQWHRALMYSLICTCTVEQSRCLWFKMSSCSLWRHCNVIMDGTWPSPVKLLSNLYTMDAVFKIKFSLSHLENFNFHLICYDFNCLRANSTDQTQFPSARGD